MVGVMYIYVRNCNSSRLQITYLSAYFMFINPAAHVTNSSTCNDTQLYIYSLAYYQL